ncbi:MAG: hypothetical protein D6677_00685 [Calditrichaeota bacterium]|nr:MAG: hypothetical protein D6677_00685 [Calditrichota bacterium]
MAKLIRVFTHPACASCGPALRMVWEVVEKHPESFQLKTVKLENKEGLQEAYKESIKTIPTIILSDGDKELERFVGTPTREQLKVLTNYLNK